jgi:hypothetical protein
MCFRLPFGILFLKEAQIPKFCIFGMHIYFLIFASNLMRLFFPWNLLSSYGFVDKLVRMGPIKADFKFHIFHLILMQFFL